MLIAAIPIFAIALWLVSGGPAYPHALIGGVTLLLLLVVTPLIWWLTYRALLAREQHALSQLDTLRGRMMASDARLSAIIESAMDAVVVTDQHRRIVIFNPAAEHLFGYLAVAIVGQPLERLLPERYRASHADSMQHFAATGQTNRRMGAGEVKALHADGHEIPVEVSIAKTMADGAVFYTAILRDITERKAAEAEVARRQRMYAALVKTGHAVTRSRDRDELFGLVSEIAVSEGGLSSCWIGWIDGQRIMPMAQCNMDPAYLAQLDITLDPADARSRGPSATAARSGTPYICNDFALDPNTAPWQEKAHVLGLRASAAFPLRRDGAVVGTLNVYAAEVNFFTPDMIELLSEMAGDLSFGLDTLLERELREEAEGIMRQGYEALGARVRERTEELFEANERLKREIAERERTEAALRISDTRFNEAQRVGRVGSWELDLRSNVLEWSDEIFRIFEIDPTRFGASYEAFLNAVHPDDRERVNRAYVQSVADRQPYEITHRLQMADGRIKYVRERCETFYEEDQPVRSIGTVQDITEQMLTELELRRTRDLLQAILDSTPDWIFVKDTEHRFLLANKGFAAALGVTPADMIGCPDTEFWPPELCEGDPARGIRGFHQDDRDALSGRFIHNPYDPASDAQGNLRIFDTLKGPLRDEDGRIYGVLAYARDVTERSETEKKIRALNETLEERVRRRTIELEVERTFIQTVLDTAGALVLVVDARGGIIRVNRALCQATGLPPEALMAQPAIDMLVPADLRADLYDLLSRLVESGESEQLEIPVRGADGGLRVVDWTISPIMDADGRAEYLVAAGMDVTMRQITERALRENEQLLREVADNIRQVIFVRDVAQDRMIFVSPAYEEIWGRPRDELYADPRAFVESVHPEDRPAVLAGLQAQAGAGSWFNQEYRVIRPEGGQRWVSVRAFPIADESGTVYRVAGLAEDISERRAAEEIRLKYLRAQRDNLVREVHHRIKNNLQGVAGLLRNHIQRAPMARDVLENVITQIHAVALVHGLQGRAGYDEVRLCDVVNAVCDAIQSLTDSTIRRSLPALKGTQCAHVTPDEVVPVSLIVNELIFNAVKHRQRDSLVHVSVELENDVARVLIANRATPLPAHFSFASGKGLGTGLTLVRSLLPPDTGTIEYQYEDGEIQTIFTLRAPTVTVRA